MKESTGIEVTYGEALAGKPFNCIKEETIPDEAIPAISTSIRDWDVTADERQIELAERIRGVALPALVEYFEFDQAIGGIRATDLFSLNTLMGATIEDQVVSTLNRHRDTWDDGT